MPPKTTSETSRREAILSAALPLFLENGYEKTSMRMIATKVGCEVGLVYYYFTTKEDIFENAIALYFEQQEKTLTDLSAETKQDLNLFLDSLFAYLEKEAPSFAKTFHENVHWTVRCAIRTKFAETVKPHLEEALSLFMAENRNAPYTAPLAVKTVSEMLVGAALDSDKTYFAVHKDELRRIAAHILGTDKNQGRKRDIPSFLL